jgi:predicted PurR-regulated permease PerM
MQPDPPERAPNPYSAVQRDTLHNWLLGIIAFGIILFLLVQAQFILISLAIAIVLFSLTVDAINSIARLRIGNWRITNWLASIFAVVLISGGLLSVSVIILAQANSILNTTLTYADQAPRAIAGLFSWMGEDVEAAVLRSMRSADVAAYLRSAAGQAGNLLSATVLISLFVGFLFAERIWFHTKLINLFRDKAQADKVERIIDSIIRRVNHYLLVKTLISVVTGAMVYGVMRLMGLEFAGAVGILTFILNFLPSLGSIIATAIAALITYLQVSDPMMTALIFAVVGAIQFVNGNIIDPMLMGRALRLSSFGIIMSLAFWGVVWGIPGMFLAVPIMVAVMIVCSHTPGLRPFAILLSREGLPDTETEGPFGLSSGDRTRKPSEQAAE